MQVMLAGKVSDVNKLRYPVLASLKLDGVRAFVSDGVVYSRNFKPIPTWTKELRVELWKDRANLVGKFIKYKFFPSGSKDRPRFPVWLGFRDKIDM